MKVAIKAISKQSAKPRLMFLLPTLFSGAAGVIIMVGQWEWLALISKYAQFYTPYPGEVEHRLTILLLGCFLTSVCLVFATYYLYRRFYTIK